MDFSRPGKPTDNWHIEPFNGSFRDECLNLHCFETLGEAKADQSFSCQLLAIRKRSRTI
ncbi:hypothetical protein DF022_38220 [Burkholderia cepacia]|nr:hypothetical protein DF023_38225 [Burkholderia cepacia]RQT91647.1 hypothetical protein DF022_38220 [Burkholderia cepacia]RQZ67405.1 hypothetical protein DF056_38480 [Burkholderia cepacia]RQZ89684.1 hypothetical protein DF055_38535 [Burkholderia cepacia]RQZ95233.1 hypothetical protein DF054_38505 [Burkholderia cepacia]